MFVFILAVFLLLYPAGVHADAGRFTLEPASTEGYVGLSGIEVKAKLQVSSSDTASSVGEQAQLRVRNARDGDRCDTKGNTGPTDTSGYIYGTCYATQTGTVTIYAYSHNAGDESSDVSLTYNNPPAGQANTPTPQPTAVQQAKTASPSAAKKNQQIQQSSGGSILGQGLVEEKQVLDDGVAMPGEGGQVAAAATQPPSDDFDLLKTLIFLTGALILIIWSTYLILVQKGVIKKTKNKTADDKQDAVPSAEGNNG